ncbi:hypothetical protein PAHAL_8G115700 [Panicum hallii]|uniref:Uncharacterized protein n=1 Tax=Panicum hallii TaxID=206008 RepID=A0A2T8I8K3_9POAL|nr:hypothetical protein PAHAL_8G115700 [Panicum hallii]
MFLVFYLYSSLLSFFGDAWVFVSSFLFASYFFKKMTHTLLARIGMEYLLE